MTEGLCDVAIIFTFYRWFVVLLGARGEISPVMWFVCIHEITSRKTVERKKGDEPETGWVLRDLCDGRERAE